VFFAVGFWPVRTGGCQPIETSGRIAAVGYEPILCSHDVTNSGRLGVPHFWYLWLNCQTTVTFNTKRVVSVLDEAFTVLALKNYWKRWNNTGTAIWTDSRVGNYQYMGWADAAYVQFDSLCKRIREQRKRASNMKLEREYLARSRMQLSGGGPHSRRFIVGQVETNVEVYNELDSEDEN
jgi:hypothetical protein